MKIFNLSLYLLLLYTYFGLCVIAQANGEETPKSNLAFFDLGVFNLSLLVNSNFKNSPM
jgi:hypothetical protein